MDHSSFEKAYHHSAGQYARLVAMTVLAFTAMYVLMYSMVNSPSNIFANINQVYMAGLMVAPMVVIALVLMRVMYQRRGWNAAIVVASVVIGVGFFIGIRRQTHSGRQAVRTVDDPASCECHAYVPACSNSGR